jgi:hypothetical protein
VIGRVLEVAVYPYESLVELAIREEPPSEPSTVPVIHGDIAV